MLDLPHRLASRIRVSESGCWEWTGPCATNGYARVSLHGKRKALHRIAYEITHGEIPEGFQLDHLCRNKPCCNPDHLESVTHQENARRWSLTITHCPYGHEYTPENTQPSRSPTQGKSCRACNRIRCRAAYLRRTGRRDEADRIWIITPRAGVS